MAKESEMFHGDIISKSFRHFREAAFNITDQEISINQSIAIIFVSTKSLLSGNHVMQVWSLLVLILIYILKILIMSLLTRNYWCQSPPEGLQQISVIFGVTADPFGMSAKNRENQVSAWRVSACWTPKPTWHYRLIWSFILKVTEYISNF